MKLVIKSVYIFLAFITLIILFIPNAIKAFSKGVIIIDPGHGGFDGGCSSNNIIEKDITLKISKHLYNYLSTVGYKVILTREEDKALDKEKNQDLKKRVLLINNNQTILYVSIHANYFLDKSISGAQVFFKDDLQNYLLSNAIQEYLNIISIGRNRKEKTIKDKYLTDNASKTGCIVEVGFLSNEEEKSYLTKDTYQNKIAYAIYLGILKYIGGTNERNEVNHKNSS